MKHARLAPLLLLLALALALLLCSCASMPRMLGGSGGDVTLSLDGDQLHEVKVAAGRTLWLELRDPSPKGYALAGTLFDTRLLRLEGIEPREGGRLRYQLRALDLGQTDVMIKIRRLDQPGGAQEIFKRVAVTVEQP